MNNEEKIKGCHRLINVLQDAISNGSEYSICHLRVGMFHLAFNDVWPVYIRKELTQIFYDWICTYVVSGEGLNIVYPVEFVFLNGSQDIYRVRGLYKEDEDLGTHWKGEIGELRRDLARFLINYIENKIKELQNV